MTSKSPPLSPEEEAEVQAHIAADPDNPELTDEQIANRATFDETFPELAAKMRRAVGRPKLDRPKQKVTLRLSADVLEHYRAGGPGWQSRIDGALLETLKQR